MLDNGITLVSETIVICMGLVWDWYGIRMGLAWDSHGTRMGLVWYCIVSFYGVCMRFYVVCMGFIDLMKNIPRNSIELAGRQCRLARQTVSGEYN